LRTDTCSIPLDIHTRREHAVHARLPPRDHSPLASGRSRFWSRTGSRTPQSLASLRSRPPRSPRIYNEFNRVSASRAGTKSRAGCVLALRPVTETSFQALRSPTPLTSGSVATQWAHTAHTCCVRSDHAWVRVGAGRWLRSELVGPRVSPSRGQHISAKTATERLDRTESRPVESMATTPHSVTELLATASKVVGKLPLRPGWYGACYVPLVRQTTDSDGPVHPLLIVECGVPIESAVSESMTSAASGAATAHTVRGGRDVAALSTGTAPLRQLVPHPGGASVWPRDGDGGRG
jgi:hypothetical protein